MPSDDSESVPGVPNDADVEPEARTVRCDYCRLPIPDTPLVADHRGVDYHFCSTVCRDALESRESVFTTYHGYRQIRPGVAAMDASLPEGVPRNSFVLLSGQSGTRDEAVQAELVWRRLQAGEPVVVVSFLETPTSIAQSFASFDWNVIPYLESKQLRILDCFSYRLESTDRIYDRMNIWNRHLHDAAQVATTAVRDATDVMNVENRLDGCLEAAGMEDDGMVVIDSLTELGSLVQPVKAYDFVKGLRADVPKGRSVPVFAGATVMSEEREFPHDLGYMVDGVVDLRLNGDLVDNALLKQLRIRKMSGVLTIPRWHTYEYTAGDGMIVFDPEEEIEKSSERAEGSDDSQDDTPETR